MGARWETVRDFSLANTVDLGGLPSGLHDAEVIRISAGGRATDENPRPSQTSQREAFRLEVISPDTEFGRGWRFDEIHRLHGENGAAPDHDDESVMLVLGTFNQLVFARNSDGSYTSQEGEYSTLSAIPAPARGFLRETKEWDDVLFSMGEVF